MRSRWSTCCTPSAARSGADILRSAHRVLRPGGRLIVKEVVDRPRWKYWAIMAQEALSVRVFGITKGDRPHFESPKPTAGRSPPPASRVVEAAAASIRHLDQPLSLRGRKMLTASNLMKPDRPVEYPAVTPKRHKLGSPRAAISAWVAALVRACNSCSWR
ncbi:MAG: hypothetical protein MZU91_07375 [Desulfosudis oleivorans]|nr:hypothetical protein [Desulfosudis oleivorans]